MRSLLILFIILLHTFVFGQGMTIQEGPSHILRGAYDMKFKVKGYTGSKVYLYTVFGDKSDLVDSADAVGGEFRFQRAYKIPSGQYRVYLGGDDFFDIIFNQEDMEMHTQIDSLILKMNVVKSNENHCFYLYLKRTIPLDERSARIASYTDSSDQWKGMETERLLLEKNKYTRDLAYSYGNTLASRIIKSYVVPAPTTYLHTELEKYDSRVSFLRAHFFDNIDFNDTMLLYSESIYNSIRYYMLYLMDQKNETDYIQTADFIMGVAGKNAAMYQYVLNLLISQFENARQDVPYAYLTEKYLLKEGCEETNSEQQTTLEKVSLIKKTMLGAISPNFKLIDNKNKKVELYKINSPYLLVFFWSSHCKYCQTSVIELTKLFEKYEAKGFDIVAVNVDSLKSEWLSTIKILNNDWLHVWTSGRYNPSIRDFDVFVTPRMFMLDANKKIVFKPRNTNELSEYLEAFFANKK